MGRIRTARQHGIINIPASPTEGDFVAFNLGMPRRQTDPCSHLLPGYILSYPAFNTVPGVLYAVLDALATDFHPVLYLLRIGLDRLCGNRPTRRNIGIN